MTVKERIETAKAQLDKAEKAKTIAETQLEAATKQCDETIAEMGKYGVDPSSITNEIAALSEQVETELSEIERSIPQV
jgi:chromosome segregation ATPase